MHARITKKLLEELTDRLNIQEGRPRSAIAKERDSEGRLVFNDGHITLDFNPHYGGYALREIMESSGEAFYWPRWTRISNREMYQFLMGKLNANE